MTEKQQIDHLSDDIDRLVDRYRTEYEMSYASVVGALMMKAHLLMAEAVDQSERDDEP